MNADRAYRWLMEAGDASTSERFDLHVVASILAVAIAQADEEGAPLARTSGLDCATLSQVAHELFPAAAPALAAMAGAVGPSPQIEEKSVIDILLIYANGPIDFLRPLATMIARRCQEPHHLWQDLGLRNRGELSQLMARHFPRLIERNSGDMKWKKFLYRMVCGAEGFTLCPAPVCSDCDDFASCFGSEEGVAQLSHAYQEERL
ncbi:nitrogen fixation protein NifQ [Rhodoblastus acidophilus]|uniref:Nitrogen fixation protein NifQ n=1 Tax=Candidatus Rhodoblastus alkanivorans TaxID=2954117 RepID=A0ABS9Z9U1_9HYPH|nr:nitrogen fixation protein NifQ [Candidatus Rhodoblastus alkanivorans]MCI4677110.1 nitrogen fixation protein NifQ [Candidatus Rhodoblastus alkanivorans]MCI4684463.1 nitrogen fixation protein NifQ [Candidatus Rhodoblastus alkanivorans]MDI4641784.1 nitrogen fixation protein NifQ [Rhodoblastus acidophilus]